MDMSSVIVTPGDGGSTCATRSDGHLVLVVVELDVVEVSSKSRLQPQPALIEPGLQLLTVVDELKHPELSLQLLPPEKHSSQARRTSGGRVLRVCLCLLCM